MIISSIDPSLTDRFYQVSLREIHGKRQITIPMGEFEAQSMTITMESIPIPRPLTYDLFHTTLAAYGLRVEEIELTRFYEGTYYANLICSNGEKKIIVDARPSDAINMALKFGAPIFVAQELLDEVGYESCHCTGNLTIELSVSFDNAPKNESPSEKELEQLLAQCIADENYEEASRIQDLIEKQKNNK